ncbi:MAG: sugar ABC transporter ATP-binding protein [Acidobacteria bacterium]|nr:sugar ABC transporter ATP-binding protein [Acidobacteriota bacterium]MCG2816833.1 sugar ABC transporter ATP-binding protein [Candidatus Aminicenantes bacterium]
MTAAPPSDLLNMAGISKSFGPTIALQDVDLELKKGEIHALLGENGAGKSTLVKILSGALKADRGRMTLASRPFAPSGPLDSRIHGISMIYQELNLAPHLTVTENIMLGREIHLRGILQRKDMRRKVEKALAFLNHPEIAPDVPVRKLSISARQIIEIARALVDEAVILIMDEPTSRLSREDSVQLFQIMRRLKAQGVGIIYISHFLEEVREVADSYTVLRDGQRVGTGRMSSMSLGGIIRMMVGQDVKELFPKIPHKPEGPALSLKNFRGKNMFSPLNLELQQGEILGVGGLVGSGRTEMLRALFGLDRLEEGRIIVFDGEKAGDHCRDRIRQGMGYLSEDRQSEGLALSLSIRDNLTMSYYEPYVRWGFLRLGRQKRDADALCRRMNVKARDSDQRVSSLSGGNQQKVALARLLHQKADILLLDEPTRGIDVLSKAQIYDWVGRLAAEGKTVVFVSSYFPELIGVCDRIAVFFRGDLVSLRPAEEWTMETLTTAATVGT